MIRDIEKEASEYAAPMEGVYKDGTPVAREAYEGYLAGATGERKWWAERWREYVRLCQLPKDMSQEEIYKGRAAIMDELDQAEVECDEQNKHFNNGGVVMPVCLISPTDLDRYEQLKQWILKFKTYIECVERKINLVEYLHDDEPPNTTEEEYLLDLLKKILPEQGK